MLNRQKSVRPWSVDSLHGGFVASQICPVGRSKIKNKIKFCQPDFFPYLWKLESVGREIGSGGQNTKKLFPIFFFYRSFCKHIGRSAMQGINWWRPYWVGDWLWVIHVSLLSWYTSLINTMILELVCSHMRDWTMVCKGSTSYNLGGHGADLRKRIFFGDPLNIIFSWTPSEHFFFFLGKIDRIIF